MSDIKHELLAEYIHGSSRRRFMSIVSKVAAVAPVAGVALAQSGTGSGSGGTGTGSGSGSGTGTTGTGSTGTGSSTGNAAGSAAAAANDLSVLNYALTLEFLEASFYTQFLGQGALPTGVTSFNGLTGTVTGNPKAFTSADLTGASAFQGYPAAFATGLFSLLTQIRDHEIAHVAALIQTIQSLGGTPVQPCTYTFPVTSISDFLKVAQALENTGVSAYDGAINMISNPALVQTGATIATVEARHAAFLNLVAGGGLTSGNFQPGTLGTGTNGTNPPGVSASPFPSAFDTPLTRSQVLQIASPFLASCPTPVTPTSVVLSVTPTVSSSAPLTTNSITVDLSGSMSGTTQPIQQYSFSVPANVSSYCPGGSNNSSSGNGNGSSASGSSSGSGSSTSGSGTSSSGSSSSTGTVACPLTPAILQGFNSSKATIQFNQGTGFYPLQVTVTDSAGRTSTQVLLFAYQASTGTVTLPAGTPGLAVISTSSGTTSSSGSGTGSGSSGSGSSGSGSGGTGSGSGSGSGGSGSGSGGTGSGSGSGSGGSGSGSGGSGSGSGSGSGGSGSGSGGTGSGSGSGSGGSGGSGGGF